MADNIIGNMFGVDPDQLRMQRFQQAQQQNIQMAQLDPFQRASVSMANVGAGATMLGAQALGLQTPEEKLAASRKQALAGLDTTDPDAVNKAAQALNQSGDTQGAAMLAQHARQITREQSALGLQAAQTEKALREPAKTIETGVEGKPDYRQKMEQQPDGTWKPIGPAYRVGSEAGGMKPGDELRFMNQHDKDVQRATGVIDRSLDATGKIAAISSDPNFGKVFGGYTEKMIGKLAPGEIAGLQAKVDSLKSNLMAAGLEAMRNGQGIGAMTEREWPIMQGMIANLDPKMDEKSAKQTLGRIQEIFDRAKERSANFYDKKWKSKPQFYDPSIKEMAKAPPTVGIQQQTQQPTTQGAVRKYNPATGRIE